MIFSLSNVNNLPRIVFSKLTCSSYVEILDSGLIQLDKPIFRVTKRVSETQSLEHIKKDFVENPFFQTSTSIQREQVLQLIDQAGQTLKPVTQVQLKEATEELVHLFSVTK